MDIKEKITCIGCGYDFYMIVTDNGKTYSWGSNCHGQLGKPRLESTSDFLNESTSDFLNELCEVEISGKTIGNLFFFITHSYRYKDVWIYRKFMISSRMYMICLVKVACGYGHTLALTDKGKVYGWGANYYKQSDPNREDQKVSSPSMVNHKIIMTNRKT